MLFSFKRIWVDSTKFWLTQWKLLVKPKLFNLRKFFIETNIYLVSFLHKLKKITIINEYNNTNSG